jgi:protein TonB
MKPNFSASLAAAVSMHALLLLALGTVTAARQFPITDGTPPVNVTFLDGPSLPEPAPAPASPPVAPQPIALPSTPAAAEPAPDIPEPVADMTTPIPALIADPSIAPTHAAAPTTKQSKPARHRKAAVPHSAPGTAASLAGTAGHGVPGGPSTGVRANYLTNPRPEYPEEAKQMRQQGVVYLHVLVNADGRPDDVSVSRSSGYPLLDRAAVEAVRGWTFEPARAGGLPVSSPVEIPVRFSLAD